MPQNKPLLDKSFSYSLAAIKLHSKLVKTEFRPVAVQLLRSSTSIGANVEEAQGASSKKEFIHKLRIAYREARESRYWINLIIKSSVFDFDLTAHLYECQQLERLLIRIIKTSSGKR